jgi:hypothetical protein
MIFLFNYSNGIVFASSACTLLFDSRMFPPDWLYFSGLYCKLSERLEAFVAASQHPGIAVPVVLLVIIFFLFFFVLRQLTQYYCYFLIHRLTEESMRWLESQGKHDKVINTLKKIAVANKKPFPDLHTNTQTQVIF